MVVNIEGFAGQLAIANNGREKIHLA